MKFCQPNDNFTLGILTKFSWVDLLFTISMRPYIHMAQPYDLDHSTIKLCVHNVNFRHVNDENTDIEQIEQKIQLVIPLILFWQMLAYVRASIKGASIWRTPFPVAPVGVLT